jgi:hypothetical protein
MQGLARAFRKIDHGKLKSKATRERYLNGQYGSGLGQLG